MILRLHHRSANERRTQVSMTMVIQKNSHKQINEEKKLKKSNVAIVSSVAILLFSFIVALPALKSVYIWVNGLVRDLLSFNQ